MPGVSQAVSFGGFMAGIRCMNRRLRRFCEVCGPQALFLWPALCCSYSRSGQLHSGYFAACERTGRFPQKGKGSLIRLPLLLTIHPPTQQGSLIKLPCRWEKCWGTIRRGQVNGAFHPADHPHLLSSKLTNFKKFFGRVVVFGGLYSLSV